MKKLFVIDTNVLLSDPNSLFSFDDNDLIIPMAVLEELDAHKNRIDEVGKNARHVSRLLDKMREDGNSLVKGIKLPSGGTLKIVSIGTSMLTELPVELKQAKVDNMIIAFMLHLMKSKKNVILVSKDINVRIKCDSLGIKCEDYRKMRVTNDRDSFYTGVVVIDVEEHVIEEFYANNKIQLENNIFQNYELYPNQIVILKHVNGIQTKSAITKYISQTNDLIPIQKVESIFNLKPRNKEQIFSLDLLLDPNIKLLTLVSAAGCGKTVLAIAAALEQLIGLGDPKYARYKKLIVLRPVQSVGKEIGFLPGTLEEKMEPWISPIRDNINFLVNNSSNSKLQRKNPTDNRNGKIREGETRDGDFLSMLKYRGLVEVEAITFIRGRSIPDAFIIIDEAQNLSMHELKTIITRAGDGTKIVLTGDVQQIDNVHVDIFTNGLTYAVEKFKDQSIAGHVTLIKGERSLLASIASNIL